jgi:hypothetical protein
LTLPKAGLLLTDSLHHLLALIQLAILLLLVAEVAVGQMAAVAAVLVDY